jgi:hypothetical protein
LDFYNGDIFGLYVNLHKSIFVKISREVGEEEKIADELKEVQLLNIQVTYHTDARKSERRKYRKIIKV